mgnify:CR=1 FL=1
MQIAEAAEGCRERHFQREGREALEGGKGPFTGNVEAWRKAAEGVVKWETAALGGTNAAEGDEACMNGQPCSGASCGTDAMNAKLRPLDGADLAYVEDLVFSLWRNDDETDPLHARPLDHAILRWWAVDPRQPLGRRFLHRPIEASNYTTALVERIHLDLMNGVPESVVQDWLRRQQPHSQPVALASSESEFRLELMKALQQGAALPIEDHTFWVTGTPNIRLVCFQ